MEAECELFVMREGPGASSNFRNDCKNIFNSRACSSWPCCFPMKRWNLCPRLLNPVEPLQLLWWIECSRNNLWPSMQGHKKLCRPPPLNSDPRTWDVCIGWLSGFTTGKLTQSFPMQLSDELMRQMTSWLIKHRAKTLEIPQICDRRKSLDHKSRRTKMKCFCVCQYRG